MPKKCCTQNEETYVQMEGIILLTVLCLVSISNGERLHNQIYVPIEGAVACFRRLNGTHQAGCSSSSNYGPVGTVQWVINEEDVRWAVGGGGGGSPYILLIRILLFNRVAETLLARPDNVAGVLIYQNANETSEATYFSTESRCPNEFSASPGSQCSSSDNAVWNTHGLDLIRRDIPFPMFYIPPARIEFVNLLIDCYKRFNAEDRNAQAGRPLCSVQLNSLMFASVSSEVCTRRSAYAEYTMTKHCDPIGDRNIYASLYRRSKDVKEANSSVVLVTARIDSASLFDVFSPGAASSAVGLVTFLTAARTLSVMLPKENASTLNSNVVWALLNGESFDYIGSQRIAYDMSRGEWPPGAPLSPAAVDLHVELGQLGGALAHETAEWNISAFAPVNNAQISTFISMVQEAEPNLTVTPRYGSNLPPSSLHTFRRILGESPAQGGFLELLLVDHAQAFTNNYYQSVLDDKRNVNYVYANRTVDQNGTFLDTDDMIAQGYLTANSMQVKISRLANAVAKAVYQQVTGDVYRGNISASAHMVDEMLHCYLESANCRMFVACDYGPEEGTTAADLPDEPFPLYTGVHVLTNRAPFMTGMLLALLTGSVNTTNKDECLNRDTEEYTYNWFNGWNKMGVCIQSTVIFTDSLSPAFTIPDYDMKSGKYSTWTESVWRLLSARMFVTPSGQGSRIAAILGSISTFLVTLLTYWFHKHRNVIFSKPEAATIDINADPSSAGILRTVNC